MAAFILTYILTLVIKNPNKITNRSEMQKRKKFSSNPPFLMI